MLRQCYLESTASKTMSPATRLKHRDYSAPGLYFVTICANYKRCIFGRVSQTSVELSALGRIASECWTAIPFHFARVNVHGFMVMPNHMHGIIEIVTVRPAQQGSRKVREEGLAQHGCATTRDANPRTPAFATWFAFGDSAVPQGGGHEAWPIGIELEGRGVAEKLFRPRDSRRAGILGCFSVHFGESSEMDRGAGEARK